MEYPKHHTRITLAGKDVDLDGQLSVRSLSQMISDVASEHTPKLGVDRDTMGQIGLTWMLHSIHIRIDRWPRLGDTIEVDTYPSGMDSLFALRCYNIFDVDGNKLIDISSRWMLIDIAKRRPVRPIARLIEVNRGLQLPIDMPQGTLSSKDVPYELKELTTIIPTEKDIDFNGHVTQAMYIHWLVNTLGAEFVSKHTLCEAEVIYQHEIMVNTRVSLLIKIGGCGDCVVVYHKLVSNEANHCIGRTIWKSN